uniref:Membrane protein n=1 Tax=bacterium enrichment culture TaxID=207831 RepID=A0A0R7N6J0_9BACT|nr:membrane protein [bacterium enrichment culture]
MKRYLIAGLLVWVPLGITLWVLNALVTTLDQTLLLVPDALKPDKLLGFHIPGFGVLLSFLILLVTGAIAANFVGARLITFWEGLLGRIPFVKSIYSSVKQVSDTVLSDQGTAFRKALLVEFPREGCWTIAFLTGSPVGEVAAHLPGEHISIYVPTTPNPTGGYFVMVPKSSVRELDITVDEALKYIISMGVVAPRPPHALPHPRTRSPAPVAADTAAVPPRN